ncbi:hypothetical protein [Arcticibacter sp.]|uniref:hypothetical protein n=1 Tax=Arcticibacter sp. TaxID=1872630 RepID=UPI00388E647A
MKTILIPTDFSSQAFDCIPSLCAQLQPETLNIVFIHLFKLSDSINDLLLLSRRNKEYEHVSDDFYQQCEETKRVYKAVKAIRIEFFYGSTLSRFKNFIEANSIDYIVHPEDCTVSSLTKLSIDPSVLVGRCSVPLLRVHEVALADVAPARYKRQNSPVLSEVSL